MCAFCWYCYCTQDNSRIVDLTARDDFLSLYDQKKDNMIVSPVLNGCGVVGVF